MDRARRFVQRHAEELRWLPVLAALVAMFTVFARGGA